uniref:DUF8117 domain-containing protein n=2 Tax=Ascaris TaxID=6251 RepID=F1LA63_ASCSU
MMLVRFGWERRITVDPADTHAYLCINVDTHAAVERVGEFEKMVLPICMEDSELFPKHTRLELPEKRIEFSRENFIQMSEKLSRLWWSRLVISVRGYVINYFQNEDDMQFLLDDAFVMIHQNIVESQIEIAQQFLSDLEIIVNVEDLMEILERLDRGDLQRNPFMDSTTKVPFERVFGQSNAATYRIANAQKFAYVTFMNIFSLLQRRWLMETKKRKGIRFQEDPEWQPDERVVLFQHFFEGNRTWVLLDFDRHILKYWRPQGSAVIFGDRFIEDKKRLGFTLCAECGILEQHVGQFVEHQQKRFCSLKCAQNHQLSETTNNS